MPFRIESTSSDRGGAGGGSSRAKNQSRRTLTNDYGDIIAPDAQENRYQRGVRKVQEYYQKDLIAGPPAPWRSLIGGIGSDYAAAGGEYPLDAPNAIDLAAPPAAKPLRVVVPVGGKVLKPQKIRQAIGKNYQRIRQALTGSVGSRSDSGASRGGQQGPSYQGGTYGGYGGRSINQGVGQAFKSR